MPHHRRGYSMERNLPYSPPYAQPQYSTLAPSVAGHPATDNQHRHPLNNKKSGPDKIKSEKPLALYDNMG